MSKPLSISLQYADNTLLTAHLFFNAHAYEQALPFYQKALDQSKKNTLKSSMICYHMGEIYYQQKKLKSALTMFEKTLLFFQKNEKAL